MDQKAIVNTIYHAGVVSALTIGYAMLGKKLLSMGAIDLGKANAMDVLKLTAVVTSATFTKNWLVTQGILPPNVVNVV